MQAIADLGPCLGFAAACFRLAFWQLSRLHEKQAMNASKQAPILSGPIAPIPPLLQEFNPNRSVQRGEIPGGQPFEFNGKTYYLTPLNGSGGPPMTVAK